VDVCGGALKMAAISCPMRLLRLLSLHGPPPPRRTQGVGQRLSGYSTHTWPLGCVHHCGGVHGEEDAHVHQQRHASVLPHRGHGPEQRAWR
jgi:hypothetical protein